MQSSNVVTGSFSRQLALSRFIQWCFASAVFLALSSCNQKKPVAQDTGTFYTCSMHPQIMESHPGKCPICGMNLIAVQTTTTTATEEIQLSDQQIELGNISVDTIAKAIMGNQTVLNATVNFDEEKVVSVSSRLMGRIERLYYKNIGDYIRKGTPLFDIYSEVLNNAKQEYLLALERRNLLDSSLVDFSEIIRSAKTKLVLWGMTEQQIKTLEQNKHITTTTTVFSPQGGYLTSLDVQEGDYIAEGGRVVQVADLSTLWVETQVYTSHISKFGLNSAAAVEIPEISGKQIQGKIEFVNPEINSDKRINLLRVKIPNQNNRLKPGMPAYVVLKGKQSNSLSLPLDAVLRDANGAMVWVKTGANTFKSRMVTVGMESNDRIEITYGLKEGEAVVVSGAYLLNSEYIFRNGASSMSGHDMKNM